MDFAFSFTVAVIATAFFFESVLGFGGGIIAVPLLAQFMTPANAVATVLFFQILNSAYLASGNFRKADMPTLKALAPTMIVASFAGVFLNTYMPQKFFMAVLGVLILADLARARFSPGFGSAAVRATPAPVVGGIVGLILGAFGIGGPILVMYFNEKISDRFVFRATLIAVFFISNCVRGVTSAFTDVFNIELLKQCLLVLPFFACAIFLGQRLHNRVSEKVFRRGVEILLFLAAISLLFRAVF